MHFCLKPGLGQKKTPPVREAFERTERQLFAFLGSFLRSFTASV